MPHDDAVAARRWVAAQASRLGVDPARLCLGGASAGGNLAAGAALRVRDDGDAVRPARLLLVYSGLHPVLPEAPPELAERLRELPPALRFPPADVERIHANYAGGPPAQASGYASGRMAYLLPVAQFRSRSVSQQPARDCTSTTSPTRTGSHRGGVSAGCRRVGSHP